jgi:hypothetical protein
VRAGLDGFASNSHNSFDGMAPAGSYAAAAQQHVQASAQQQQQQQLWEQQNDAVPNSLASLGLTGLQNETGEYNCFLNVIVQCLWRCAEFRGQVGPGLRGVMSLASKLMTWFALGEFKKCRPRSPGPGRILICC